MKKLLWTLLLLTLCLPCAAWADEARDITQECIVNNRPYNAMAPDVLRDKNYFRFYEGNAISVTAPDGEQIGGVLIRWRTIRMPGAIIKVQKDGKWVELQREDPKYAAQFIALDEPASAVRITSTTGTVQVCEITVVTPGDVPADVQVWKDPPEKVDMMLFSTHPDDEVLWFGGLLPYYEGELGKDVLVVNAVYADFSRRLELLDALWTCGVDIYPVILGYPNQYKSVANVTQVWKQKQRAPEDTTLSLIRQYKPDVVVLHDIEGEYGHPAHVVFSQLGRQAVTRAADASQHVASIKAWGVWDVPKTYIHLYGENQMHMDWTRPLTAFGGKTAIEVATIALDCHFSQVSNGWRMEDSVQYNNELFGLWRTTVGPDVEKNDMFEHIPAK